MKNRTLVLLLLVVISAMLVAGCTQPKVTTLPATPQATPVTGALTGCQQNALDKSKTVMNNITGLRGNSFCEIILWCTDPGYENTGGTYGSSGLNDPNDSCPDALLKGINTTALALQYKVSLASTNPEEGRKFWIMDEFDIPTSTTVRDFSGLKAYYWAETPLGPDGKPQELDPAKVQYLDQIMGRSTYIIFEKGKPVYLMDDDEGTTWILKNYQTGVDPTLSMESLPTYDTHLKNLPPGWGNFREVILPQDLVLSAVNGTARITWDELGGSWDALDPGVANYMPVSTTAAPAPVTGCAMLKEDKEKAVRTALTGMRNMSFCELIVGCDDGTGALYGSAKLNEPDDPCPEQLWTTLDPDQVMEEYDLVIVSKNPPYGPNPPFGRKFWTLDTLEITVSKNVRIFNGALEMAWWADVEAETEIIPYNPMKVGRDSVITFAKGNQVNLLTDPSGITWIQKNYVTTPEAPMTYEQLPTLKTLLKYPSGWTFRSKVLEKDLVLTPLNKSARIMWDDRSQSWDALDPGTVNYQP